MGKQQLMCPFPPPPGVLPSFTVTSSLSEGSRDYCSQLCQQKPHKLLQVVEIFLFLQSRDSIHWLWSLGRGCPGS